MRRALRLATLAAGSTSPNPPVGAVLVREGRTVGEGYTQPPGGPHAEVVALAQAGEAARGATLHVTLEPCAHTGRTLPCTDAIIRAGVAEVRFALRDVNPLVAGRGVAALRTAGIRVVEDTRWQPLAGPLVDAHARFVQTGKPFVTVKFAASLDGRIATRSGDSKWITGPVARAYAHRIRAGVDAIITGVGTVLTDDPELTARPGGRTATRQPLRVVVDSHARTPPDAKVLTSPGHCVVATASGASDDALQRIEAAGACVLRFPGEGERVSLKLLLAWLAQQGRINLLVEAGGTLLGSFFDDGLVDRVLAFIAPVVIGGGGARPAVGGSGPEHLHDAFRLERTSVRRLGADLLVQGYRSRAEGG
ncbi:MAG: bifunctional diaminohydroxyphosphoribosylaminopyrimidine deaminase/5-amino-6-(5-phosphoribosylamino)uracil reductase RibD [Dehalococcoidia bacterium]|nr:bifunctional diaminohydroxyphosphoribosylaminopyrimidine deaminase/5-amino-6-(5-phosphoribosylamino)uracil reductase RibD [Dehalococcoidia bacterium]